MKKIIYTVIISLVSFNAFAQDTAKLDSLFKALEENDRFMGSISITKDGLEIYSNAIGYTDIATNKKATKKTKYRIGSITKMFTAVLILKSVEENKIKLETNLAEFYPEIENAKEITIGNLLNHRSGIFNFTNNPKYLNWNTEPKTEKELIKIIKKGGSVFTPNSKAEYSNSNYVLLTFILEKINNTPYSELAYKNIIKPLRLKHTYLGKNIDLNKNESNSYTYSGEWVKKNETDMSIPLGAGAMVSNPSDLNIFIKALFDGKIISENSLSKMTTLTDNYGMGMFQFPFNDKKSYGHTGGIDGFSSMSGYFPKEKLAITLCSNGANYNTNNIIILALSWAFDIPFTIPETKQISLSETILESYTGIYASLQMPLKITITSKGTLLFAQATGQSSFPLETVNTTTFEFKQAKIKMVFNPKTNKMMFSQNGANFEFSKE